MKARRDSVRDVIVSSGADIVCLQETKVMAVNHFFLGSVFGSNFVLLPADGTRGGYYYYYCLEECNSSGPSFRVDSHSVSVQFAEVEGRNWWFTGGVYGPQEDDDKLAFLQELRDI